MGVQGSGGEAAGRRTGGFRAAALRLVLAGASLLVTLLLAEGVLRLFHPVELHPTDTFLMADTNAARAGLIRLRPGSQRYRDAEFDIQVTINSHGFRDREIPVARTPGVYRGLVLGDSQTFGWGVEMEESFPKVAERRLTALARRKVELINTAVPATGTAQQLYFLEHEGWQSQPDVVVVGVFLFNDIGENGQSRLYGVQDGRLVRGAPPEQPDAPLNRVVDWDLGFNELFVVRGPRVPKPAEPSFLIRHSHLARFVRERLSAAMQARRPKIEWNRMSHAREVTAHTLEEIARQCEERSVPCLMVLLPSLSEYEDPKFATLTERYSHVLGRLLARKAEVLDILPVLREHAGTRLYYPKDQHLTREGQRIVGEVVARRLVQAIGDRR